MAKATLEAPHKYLQGHLYDMKQKSQIQKYRAKLLTIETRKYKEH